MINFLIIINTFNSFFIVKNKYTITSVFINKLTNNWTAKMRLVSESHANSMIMRITLDTEQFYFLIDCIIPWNIQSSSLHNDKNWVSILTLHWWII
jgi:hypothetical protein